MAGECVLDLDDNSFSSTVVDYKFNNDKYRSGYDISGDVFGNLIQEETFYDGGTRRYGDTWYLGKYEKTVGSVMYYTRGTWCDMADDYRKTQIRWKCGDSFRIRSMTEKDTCVYHIVANKKCTSDPEKGPQPEDRVEELSTLVSEYLDLWFSDNGWFANKIQSKVDTTGQRMVKYFQSNKYRLYGLCHQKDEEETDDLRLVQYFLGFC